MPVGCSPLKTAICTKSASSVNTTKRAGISAPQENCRSTPRISLNCEDSAVHDFASGQRPGASDGPDRLQDSACARRKGNHASVFRPAQPDIPGDRHGGLRQAASVTSPSQGRVPSAQAIPATNPNTTVNTRFTLQLRYDLNFQMPQANGLGEASTSQAFQPRQDPTNARNHLPLRHPPLPRRS